MAGAVVRGNQASVSVPSPAACRRALQAFAAAMIQEPRIALHRAPGISGLSARSRRLGVLVGSHPKAARTHPQHASHSGLLEPRGTSTVLKDPGVRDMNTWSVNP